MAPPLLRDPRRRVIAGVAAGIAEHLNVDPLLIRLAFVLLALLHGLGVLLYVIAWVAIPCAPREPPAGASPKPSQPAGGGQRVLGIVLIVLGGLFLLDRFSWWRWPRWGSLATLWPVGLIIAGALMIFGGKNRSTS